MNLAILDDYLQTALDCADWSRLAPDFRLQVFDRPFADADAAARELSPFEVIVAMRERTPFDAGLLDRLPRLRLLVTTGMRNLAIDLEACRRKAVMVCGTRSSQQPVASTVELAWTHILALSKGLTRADRDTRAGNWQTALAGTVSGKVLGLVGLGKLGSQMAALGRAFGMQVIAWSRHLDRQRARDLGVEPVGKPELFARADFVSLHVVLGERTRHLVGAEDLARMKPTACLVNTARAGLVDQKALVTALRERRIAGAGIDVYEREPVGPDDPLAGLDNVLLTPHLGYATEDNFRVYYQDAIEDIMAWAAGRPIRLLS